MRTLHSRAALQIGPDTRVSKVIRADERAIEALAALSSKFKKLRNPILRKVMAPRVTLAEAAKIGGVAYEEMKEALSALGFGMEEEEDRPTTPASSAPGSTGDPELIADLKEEELHPLDVRPILEEGKDPFSPIMEALQKIPDGEALKLINSFEPIPLIRKLERKGYGHYVEQEGEELVITYLRKRSSNKDPRTEQSTRKGQRIEADPDALSNEFGEKADQTDVRGMEMPEPMMRILEHLRGMPTDRGLYVQHERVPRYLLPELEQQGFSYAIKELEDEKDVRLFIFRGANEAEG